MEEQGNNSIISWQSMEKKRMVSYSEIVILNGGYGFVAGRQLYDLRRMWCFCKNIIKADGG